MDTNEKFNAFPAGGSSVGQKNLSVGQPGRSEIMDAALAREVGRRDRGKHNCLAHGYNLRDEHVCLRCGKPIE